MPVLVHAHGHLALRVGSAGDIVDREQLQITAAGYQGLYGLEDRIDGAVSLGPARRLLTVNGQGQFSHGRLAGFHYHPH